MMGTALIAKALACLCSRNALSADSDAYDQWIFDSGATCHMSNNEAMFSEVHALCNPIKVKLGDGRNLLGVVHGNVILTVKVHKETKRCTLHILLVTNLA